METETLNPELKADVILFGEKLYAEAIDIILASAQHTLCIFDQDFRRGDFSSLKKYTLLRSFLSNHLNLSLIHI